MTQIVGFISQKGGVGKSTLARGLSREAAASGLNVKLADLDTQQGTSSIGIGADSTPGQPLFFQWKALRPHPRHYVPPSSSTCCSWMDQLVRAVPLWRSLGLQTSSCSRVVPASMIYARLSLSFMNSSRLVSQRAVLSSHFAVWGPMRRRRKHGHISTKPAIQRSKALCRNVHRTDKLRMLACRSPKPGTHSSIYGADKLIQSMVDKLNG